jgi:polar amino acid transport system substrate-binding protein
MKKMFLLISVLILSVLVASCGSPAAPAPAANQPEAQQPAARAEGELQMFTEELPPITFSQNDKAAGLAVEVVQEIMKRNGKDIPIQVVPWARGYKAAQEEPLTGLFTMTRSEQREKLFKWVGPLTQEVTSFYALKDSTITISSLEDAKKLEAIGDVVEYSSLQYLQEQGFKNLDTSADPNALIRKLMAGRIPVMVNTNTSLGSALKDNGAKPEDVKLLYTFITTQSYLAFSLDTPDELVQQWQKTLDEMKADGTFAEIYGKWLPGDEPPQ